MTAPQPGAIPGRDLERLRETHRGAVLLPSDSGYRDARAMWNAAVDHQPSVIARCTDTDDVRAAVAFARRHDLPVAIRGGGHGIAFHPAVDGAVMVDLSLLNGVSVNPVTRRATVGAGVTWGRLDRATCAHGLAVTGADVSSVGVIGSVLVGGSGWLQRTIGLTCDNITTADVVLADSELVTAGPHSHEDLWWALRGGGGNFGIVTSLELALHPVTDVYGGTLVYRYDRARSALHGFRSVCETAPEPLATQIAILHWPPGNPQGPPMVALSAAYFGPAEQARETMKALRAIAEPELDLLRPLPYLDLQSQSEHAFLAGHATSTGTEWLRGLSDDTIDRLIDAGRRMPTKFTMISLHQLGGHMSRTPLDDTAFGYRDADYHLAVFSSRPADTDPAPTRRWIHDVMAAASPNTAGGPYLALLDTDTPPARLRSAFLPASYQRLTEIKAAYDPRNTFRCNHNIPPAHGGESSGIHPGGLGAPSRA
ncbi:FAD-binding oxidoreductase [Nocardia sp. CNY236]|uniref:FAD-binding oxidoreductase n=1 Tax=Nocardia sp. CNY236 TaxID=1169152 RepID=UPI0003F6DD49|nr:FAD-binding oxidoreductase [Nocardia sp. CNY236]